MKISKKLLKTMAAGLILGATITSCEKSELLILQGDVCTIDCDLDHVHATANKGGEGETCYEDCGPCGMG